MIGHEGQGRNELRSPQAEPGSSNWCTELEHLIFIKRFNAEDEPERSRSLLVKLDGQVLQY